MIQKIKDHWVGKNVEEVISQGQQLKQLDVISSSTLTLMPLMPKFKILSSTKQVN